MKQEFKDFNQQMMYINKFLDRSTNVERKCQFCGAPAEIRHNYEDPYRIQLVCKTCKQERNLKNKELRGKMIEELPVIDLRNHITNPATLRGLRKNTLTLGEKQMIKEVLRSKFTRQDVYKHYQIGRDEFLRRVMLYEKEVDSRIREKLTNVFNQNYKQKMRVSKLEKSLNEQHKNNISKLKLKHKLSSSEIEKLTKGVVQAATLSDIANSKRVPKMRTKCAIAEVFEVPLSKVFPDEYLFDDIYCYEDYLDLNSRLKARLKKYLTDERRSGRKKVIYKVAEALGVSVNVMYSFFDNKRTRRFTHDEIVKLLPIFIHKDILSREKLKEVYRTL